MAKLPKRTGNTKRKERRAASWQRGQERKSARRSAQAERERVNSDYRKRGEPTPAEKRYRQRRAYRRVVQFLRAQYGTCVRSYPETCHRPYGHKGQCGNLTQTEIRMAAKIQAVDNAKA